MQRVRKNGRLLGASANVPDMWDNTVLRQFAESARHQTCARQRAPGDRLRATKRKLAVLLSR